MHIYNHQADYDIFMEENDLYGKYRIFIQLRKNRKNTKKYKNKKRKIVKNIER